MMGAWFAVTLFTGALTPAAAGSTASPEEVLRSYLGAVKQGDFAAAYEHVSKAMRGEKEKDAWVAETKAFMSFADVKIFTFTIHPGKIGGDKAQVPNRLESQDRFINALGLTEYELYTLVREDGAWKVDSQLLLEPSEVPKWFPEAEH